MKNRHVVFIAVLVLAVSISFGRVSADGPAQIAVIATTTVDGSVLRALDELGYSYDYYNDFPSDYSVYEVIIQAMDGGTITQIPEFASYIEGGGCGILIGGSSWEPFVNDVDTYLMDVDTTNYYWTIVSGTPDITIVDPNHCLARDLLSTYNFIESAATYYMLRITDPDVEVVAINGDGEKAIVAKNIGAGRFICFINSPYESYWNNDDDYQYLKTFIRNALECCMAKPVGGAILVIDKLSLMLPWFLIAAVITSGALIMARRKHL